MTSQVKRVPPCPDCGEPGVPVKKDYFRCSDRLCGSTWRESNWEERLLEEQVMVKEMQRMYMINSLISMGNISCDNCGANIPYGARYCYNSQEEVSDIDNSLHTFVRGTRYCKACSIKKRYLRLIENTKTGQRLYAMMMTKEERLADPKLGECPPKKEEVPDNGYGYCVSCEKPLVNMVYSKSYSVSRLVCDNWRCNKYRYPVGKLGEDGRVLMRKQEWEHVKSEE